MASCISASPIFIFTVSILFITPALLRPTSCILLPRTPQFDLDLLLIGDAQSVGSGSSVELTDPKSSSSSSGLLLRRKPFRFPVSFSTDFVFSISSGNGDGLTFVIVPADFLPRFCRDSFGLSREKKFFGVEYDTFMNVNVGDENANHVGVDVGSLNSVSVCNVSSINLVLSSGLKLHSWVDYDSSSKRLEIRLSEFGSPRPYTPLLAYEVDLGRLWKGKEVMVGLSSSSSSSSGNSTQNTTVYSWKFSVRSIPKWLHSEPLDPLRSTPKWLHSEPVNPHESSREKGQDRKIVDKVEWGLIRIVCALIFAAFVVIMLRLALSNGGNQVRVIPVKGSTNPGDFGYQKVNAVLDGGLDDIKH